MYTAVVAAAVAFGSLYLCNHGFCHDSSRAYVSAPEMLIQAVFGGGFPEQLT